MFDMYFVSDRRHEALNAELAPHYTLAWQLSVPDAVERIIAYARSIGTRKASAYLLDASPEHPYAAEMLMENWGSGRTGVLLGARTQAEFEEAITWRSAVLGQGLGISAQAVELLLDRNVSEQEPEQER